jgi:HlyD family secretion protein
MGMDVKRDPKILRRKRIRQIALAALAAVAILGISVAVMRLRPAAPTVPVGTVWVGVVQKGPLVREVHGAGTLVPEDIRWIPATTGGRVEQVVLQAGAQIKKGTVMLVLDSPDLEGQLRTADLDWKSSKAQLENTRVTLDSKILTDQSAVSDASSQLEVQQSLYDADKSLKDAGIVSEYTLQQANASLQQANNKLELAKKTLKADQDSMETQIAPSEALVAQKKEAYDQAARQVEDLKVKSPLDGSLQLVSVDPGQEVTAGLNLVRVADPSNLKANVKISETQMKDLVLGLPATIDTRNGIVKGHVSRIDPAAVGGTVGVDVILEEKLPPGARQDMSVDGTIELQKLDNVLKVQHPAFGQENSTVSLFKIALNNIDATRVTVKFGAASVNEIEIADGLKVGDKVILSDMSQYDSYDRIRGDGPFPAGGG